MTFKSQRFGDAASTNRAAFGDPSGLPNYSYGGEGDPNRPSRVYLGDPDTLRKADAVAARTILPDVILSELDLDPALIVEGGIRTVSDTRAIMQASTFKNLFLNWIGTLSGKSRIATDTGGAQIVATLSDASPANPTVLPVLIKVTASALNKVPQADITITIAGVDENNNAVSYTRGFTIFDEGKDASVFVMVCGRTLNSQFNPTVLYGDVTVTIDDLPANVNVYISALTTNDLRLSQLQTALGFQKEMSTPFGKRK